MSTKTTILVVKPTIKLGDLLLARVDTLVVTKIFLIMCKQVVKSTICSTICVKFTLISDKIANICPKISKDVCDVISCTYF